MMSEEVSSETTGKRLFPGGRTGFVYETEKVNPVLSFSPGNPTSNLVFVRKPAFSVRPVSNIRKRRPPVTSLGFSTFDAALFVPAPTNVTVAYSPINCRLLLPPKLIPEAGQANPTPLRT